VKFKDIYGQEGTKTYLKSLIERNRFPHAILFSGKKGCGKLALALATVAYIQCRNRIDGDSCGECPSCRKSFQLIHPDIHYVFPTYSKDTKSQPSSAFYEKWRERIKMHPYFDLNDWMDEIEGAKKKANIPKVSLLEMNKNFSLRIYEGNKKISIIWQSELMEKEGNRILKLIEEPPENSVFIFLTENLDQILSTIISRCQVVKIPPFTDDDLKLYLSEKMEVDPLKKDQIVQLADGNMHEMIKLSEYIQTDVYAEVFDWLRLSFKGNALDIINWSETFLKKSNHEQIYFYKYGLKLFKQFLMSYSLPREEIRLTDESFQILENLKAVIDHEKLFQITALLNDCIRNRERNANVKLQMINSSLTLHKLMTGK